MWIALHAAALLAWLGAWCLAGRALVRRRDGDRFPWLGAWVVGLALASLSTLALAAVGLLPAAGVGWWLLLAVPAIPGLVAAARARSPRAAAPPPDRGALVAGLLYAALLLPIAFLAATPTVSWDADAYHLSVPRAYLEAGGLRPIAMNVYSNWPLATEMLYLQALGLLGPSLAKLAHFAFGALILLAFGSATTRDGGSPSGAGLLAGLLWLANPVVLFEARVAYVELAQVFWLLAAFLLLERARTSSASDGLPALAGIAAGMLAATKLTGVLQVALLAVVSLPGILRRHGRRSVAAFLAPAALLAAPWPLKAWWATGNPVYPFAWPVFGGPDWNAALGERLAAWQRSIGPGRDPGDWLLLLPRIFLAGGRGYENFDGELAAAGLVLLPLGFLGLVRLAPGSRGRARRAAILAGLLFLLWATTSQQMRLLLPALAPACLAAGVGLAALLPARRDALVLAVAGLSAVVVAGNREVLGAGWRAAVPLATRPVDEIRASGVPPWWREVGRRVPGDAVLLLLQNNGRLHAPCEVLADSFFEASQIADWLAGSGDEAEVLRRFRERGVTHVLLDRQPRGTTWPPALVALLGRDDLLRAEWTSPDGRWRLWSVPPPDPGGRR